MNEWEKIKKVVRKKAERLGTEYVERLEIEIKEIEKQGANDQWVDALVSRKKKDTNENGLVLLFLLKITPIDPIKEEIQHIWEYQQEYPDIDVDFLPFARDPVKLYATEKYGADKVCSVGLWQTYKPKLAIQDSCRAVNGDLDEVYKMTKTLPDDFDQLTSLDEALELRNSESSHNFGKFFDYYDNHKDIIEKAFKLVKKIKTQGKHAGGIIISKIPLDDILPMSLLKNAAGDYIWTSQWTEGVSSQLSKFGLIKFDILGLLTLEHIWVAEKFIKENRGIEFNWDDIDPTTTPKKGGWEIKDGKKKLIDLDDKDAIKLATEAKTDSVFQFDANVAKSIIKGNIRSFWDYVIMTSLGRPGPMEMIPLYLERRDDKTESWKKEEHPRVTEILGHTYNCIVFQESLQTFWIKLCGLTVPEAEAARKAVAKKKVDVLMRLEKKVVDGGSRTIGKKDAQKWWNRMVAFGRYAFNMSHAVGYSLIIFRCLYLKAHYPNEWWASVMSKVDPKKLGKYIGIAKSENVNFGILDVNHLTKLFSVSGNQITLGLKSIKGIGNNIAEKLAIKDKKFNSFDEFVNYNGKLKIAYEKLIKLGAFDKLHKNRKGLWMWYLYKYDKNKEIIKSINSKFWPEDSISTERERQEKEYRKTFPKRNKIPVKIKNWKPRFGPKYDKPAREDIMELFDDYSVKEKLEFERESLGSYWTNPMVQFESGLQIEKEKDCIVEVVIEGMEDRTTKNNNPYRNLTITDGVNTARVIIWGNDINSNDQEVFNVGAGIRMSIVWNDKFNSFNLEPGTSIFKLDRMQNGTNS